MASVSEPNSREQVSALLRKINEAWLAARSDELSACFREDAAICGPDFKVTSRGRQACVKSYEDFVRQAVVREFKASDSAIDLWGSTAVAVCEWQIAYRMNSQDYCESGHDVYVLTHEEGRWRVVWRAVLPSPQP
jgi:uncharacterized protein DUF4440